MSRKGANNEFTLKLKDKKRIALDYHPDIINLLIYNKIKFDIINYCSYREED